MAGIILIQDLFEGIPNDIDIAGRVPPTTESGEAWKRDSAWCGGDGAGNIKFTNSSGGIIKTKTLAESSIAVRVIWNDGGDDTYVGMFIGDYTSSTIFPRNAYVAYFGIRQNIVCYYRYDNFNGVQIGPNVTTAPWTALGTDNTFVFQRNGNVFSALVNGTSVAGGFTDATYAPNGARRYHGVIVEPPCGNTRLRSFEVLDSVDATGGGGAAYTIVEVF